MSHTGNPRSHFDDFTADVLAAHPGLFVRVVSPRPPVNPPLVALRRQYNFRLDDGWAEWRELVVSGSLLERCADEVRALFAAAGEWSVTMRESDPEDRAEHRLVLCVHHARSFPKGTRTPAVVAERVAAFNEPVAATASPVAAVHLRLAAALERACRGARGRVEAVAAGRAAAGARAEAEAAAALDALAHGGFHERFAALVADLEASVRSGEAAARRRVAASRAAASGATAAVAAAVESALAEPVDVDAAVAAAVRQLVSRRVRGESAGGG